MRGADLLVEAIPGVALEVLAGGRKLSPDLIAKTISVAIITSLVMIGLHLALSLGGAAVNGILGRSLVRRRDGSLGGLRWLAGWAMMVLPWYRVAQIGLDGVVPTDLPGEILLVGLLWLALRACDHRALWLNLDKGIVQASRGFAIFRRTYLTLQLDRAFLTPRGRPAGPVERIAGRRVGVAPEAVAALAPYVGGEAKALAFLRQVAEQAGGKPTRSVDT